MSWSKEGDPSSITFSSGAAAVPDKISIDDAIDRLHKGKFHRRLLAAAGMCNGTNAMAVMVLSFIRPAITVEFDLTVFQADWLASSVFFGILIGTLIFGPLGDAMGRKPIFLLSATLTAVCSIVSAWSPTYMVLVFLRFGVGVGVGGTVIPFDTLAELTHSNFRGAYLLYLGYFWTVGTSLTPILAAYAMQEKGSWRLFLLLSGIPSIISSLFGWLWVPESPRWLMTKHRSEDALAILRQSAQQNHQDPLVVYPPGTVILQTEEESESHEMLNSMSSLFARQWRFMIICMLLIWSFLDFIYWGTIEVVTLVFAEFDGNINIIENFEEGEQFIYDYGAILSSSLAEVIGQTAVLLLIDRVGRVPTQAVAYALGALAVFSLCLVAYMEETGSHVERFGLVLLAFLARMFMMAATSVTWVHTAEMLPTQIRNTAHAVADALAGAGGACSPFVVSPANSMLSIGLIMGSITIVTAALAWMLPETRGVALGMAISRSSSAEPSLDDANESRKSILSKDDDDISSKASSRAPSQHHGSDEEDSIKSGKDSKNYSPPTTNVETQPKTDGRPGDADANPPKEIT